MLFVSMGNNNFQETKTQRLLKLSATQVTL